MPDITLSALHGSSHLSITTIIGAIIYLFVNKKTESQRERLLLIKVTQLVRVEPRISTPAD